MIRLNKEYRVYSVKKGFLKSGKDYTIMKIADAEKDANSPNGWAKKYYSVFVMDNVNAYENAKISFGAIDGIKYSESNFNGKTYFNCTIYVSKEFLSVVGEPQGESITDDDGFTPWNDDDMPF